MKKKFSLSWEGSKQRRKQRKYLANAPLHIQRKFISSHLSKPLKEKYNRRSLGLKKGDVEKKIYITNIHIFKKDGTKTFYPIHPSNLIIQELNVDDKKRQKVLDRKKK